MHQLFFYNTVPVQRFLCFILLLANFTILTAQRAYSEQLEDCLNMLKKLDIQIASSQNENKYTLSCKITVVPSNTTMTAGTLLNNNHIWMDNNSLSIFQMLNPDINKIQDIKGGSQIAVPTIMNADAPSLIRLKIYGELKDQLAYNLNQISKRTLPKGSAGLDIYNLLTLFVNNYQDKVSYDLLSTVLDEAKKTHQLLENNSDSKILYNIKLDLASKITSLDSNRVRNNTISFSIGKSKIPIIIPKSKDQNFENLKIYLTSIYDEDFLPPQFVGFSSLLKNPPNLIYGLYRVWATNNKGVIVTRKAELEVGPNTQTPLLLDYLQTGERQ
jgi:hypothetical protein